jgi:hypothetical protein
MTDTAGIALPSGNAWIKDTLYIVCLSDAGSLQVLSAKTGESFTPIPPSGPAPVNRSNFSLSSFGSTRLLVIGGDGVGVDATELWLFDLDDHTWTQLTSTLSPIRRRSAHCSIAVGQLVYTFGGTNGLDFSQELIVWSISADLKSYTNNVLAAEGDGPVARCCHTMTLRKASIWMFGGVREDGGLLNDLWELDFSLFPQIPRWRAPGQTTSQKRAPPARCSCVSWADKTCFYVAGGMNKDDKVLNEIWRYSNRWDLHEIYDADSYLAAFSGAGLLLVSEGLEKAVTQQPFAQLDLLFETLRSKQREFKLRVKMDNANLIQVTEHVQMLSKQRAAIDKFLQTDGQDKEGIPAVVSFYGASSHAADLSEIAERRSQIAGVASEIIAQFPNHLANRLPLCRPDPEEQATQLALKLQQSKDELERIIAERESEIEILREHLQFITPDAGQIPALDCADFDSFTKFVSGMPKEQQDFALRCFYQMQLREYQSLLDMTRLAKEKSTKLFDGEKRRNAMVSRLSDELTAKFAGVSIIEQDLAKWRGHLEEAADNCRTVSEFLDATRVFHERKDVVDQKIQALQAKNLKLQQQLKGEFDDLVTKKKEAIEKLLAKIGELSEAVKDKTAEESTSLIDIEYQDIQELANTIVPKSSSK